MKLMIVAINYSPELTGIGKYVGEMASWAALRGHEVVVVTAPPYYPAWKVGEGYSGWKYRRETLQGVDVRRCPLYVPQTPSGLKRILHLLSFALTSMPVILWEALKRRPDLVFVVEPPIFCAPVALLAGRLCGAKTWLHIQDFEVDAAFEMGFLKSPVVRRAISRVELGLMRMFDRVSTISENMLGSLSSKSVVESRKYFFPNWVDIQQIRPEVSSRSLREELGIPEQARVMLYSGTMGQKHGLDFLVDVAHALDGGENLIFLFCGNGPARPALQEKAARLGNVRFVDLQPAERLNELLNLAHIHLLPQRLDVEDLVMPSKLTAMMASGRPVVATARAGTSLAKMVQRCGVAVTPGDLQAFVGAIRRLLNDGDEHGRLGYAARKVAVESFDQDAVLSRAFSPDSIDGLGERRRRRRAA